MLTSDEPVCSSLTRREVLVSALATLTLPLAVRAASGSSPARGGLPLHKVLYEPRHSESVAFGRAAAALGAPVEPVGDLAALWFDDLAPMWRVRRMAVAGMTSPNVLLCLEQFARETRQRVVFRVDHREPAPNIVVHHLATATGWREPPDLGRDWPRVMAHTVLGKHPDLTPEQHTSTSRVTASTLTHTTQISWIMAPSKTARLPGSST